MNKAFIIIILMLFSFSVDAINVGVGVHFSPSGINTIYTVNNTLKLSSLRIESNAIYLNNSIFKHYPYSGSIKVFIETYNPPSLIKYKINTTSTVTVVNNTVGGFNANDNYSIIVDGNFWKTISSNSSGVIKFNYSNWSNHTFEITKSANVICYQYIYNSDGNVVSYRWGNWTASPGATNVDGDANKTYIKAYNNGSADGNATISWSYAYFANGSNQISFSGNNIKYYYGVGDIPANVTTWNSQLDGDNTFTVTVPAGSTLWIYYEIQQIPTALPAGIYTQTFTWSAL